MKRFNKHNPCPICSSHKCKGFIDKNIVNCRVDTERSGWKMVKSLYNGFYVYLKDTEQQIDNVPRKIDLPQNLDKPSIQNLTASIKRLLLSESVSSTTVSEFASERGLSAEQVKNHKFISLRKGKTYNADASIPGFDQYGRYHGISGVLIPCYASNGLVHGFQVKTRESDKKYCWTTYYSKGKQINSAQLVTGELPHTLIYKNSLDRTLYLSEGTLKPIVIAERFSVNVFGSSGGAFQPQQTRTVCNDSRFDSYVYLVDAGSLSNPNVKRMIENTVKIFKENGKELLIADWGQLYDKNAKDADELTQLSFSTISLESSDVDSRKITRNLQRLAYKASDSRKECARLLTDTVLSYKPGELPEFRYNHNLTVQVDRNDRRAAYVEARRKGYKVVLDASTVGFGKSHSIGELTATEMHAAKLFYISKQSRYPTTRLIENNYADLPPRHNGLYAVPGKETPNGDPVLTQNPKPGYPLIEEANCGLAEDFTYIQQAGLSETHNPCTTCPVATLCSTGYEPGEYGYRYQVAQALANTEIRSNINSLTPRRIPENSVAVIDEYSQSLDFTETTHVGQEEWLAFIAVFRKEIDSLGSFATEFIEFVTSVLTRRTRLDKRYGLSFSELLEMFGYYPILQDSIAYFAELVKEENEARLQSKTSALKPWFVHLVEILSHKVAGSVALSANAITITRRNEQLLEKLNSFDTTFYLDATSNREYLATALNTDKEDILVIVNTPVDFSNLTVYSIRGLGKLTNNRSVNQIKRVESLRATFEKKFNSVGFIDWKKYSRHEDLNHFVDSRGSNRFQDKTNVVAFGVPYTNVGGARQFYEATTGKSVKPDSIEFQRFYDYLTHAEIEQEIGRLRSINRTEEVNFYLVGDFDLGFLRAKNINVVVKQSYSIDPENATNQEKFQKSLLELGRMVQISTLSVREIAKLFEMPKSTVDRHIRDLGGLSLIDAFLKDQDSSNLDITAIQLLPLFTFDARCTFLQSLLDCLESYTAKPLALPDLPKESCHKRELDQGLELLQPSQLEMALRIP